jgi:hypothetical protein
MYQTVLTIQTLGFITGTILFCLMLFLTRRAESPAEEKRARLMSGTMGLVWNVGNVAEYLLRLSGYDSDAQSVMLARAVSYSSTAFLSTAIFMMLSVAPGQSIATRKWRWAVPLSSGIGTLLSIGFFATALVWQSQFTQVMLLSAYNLALHLVAGSYLFRRQRQRSGYRVALLVSVATLAALLFLQIYISWSATLELTLMIVAQQSSIPMALIALAWLSQFRFADLFVKQSFLILAAMSLALTYQWFVVLPLTRVIAAQSAQPQATTWIVSTLLWAAALWAFPLLRRTLIGAADKWIFKRPDYQKFLPELQQAIAQISNENELLALVEQRVGEALRVTEASIDAVTSDAAFLIRDKSGARYALNIAVAQR